MTKKIIIFSLLSALIISLGVVSISCTTNANADNEPKPADGTLDNYYTKGEIDTLLSEYYSKMEFDTIVEMLDQIILKLDEGNDVLGIMKTGQTTSYATSDDGDLQTGTAWPIPRFTDNGDGTVTDNLTGLIWLKDAKSFGLRQWTVALSDCSGLTNGVGNLTDGSVAGDWRLPSIRELYSLIDYRHTGPALSDIAGTGHWSEGNPFTNVQIGSFWSSTTYSYNTDDAWFLDINIGMANYNDKFGITYYVWPVRGGN